MAMWIVEVFVFKVFSTVYYGRTAMFNMPNIVIKTSFKDLKDMFIKILISFLISGVLSF